LRAAQEIAPDGMEVTIFDIRELPFYDGDLEAEGDLVSVTALKQAVRNDDGVIFATPEYNWGTSRSAKKRHRLGFPRPRTGLAYGKTGDHHRRRW